VNNNKELLFESLNAQDTVDFNDKITWGDKDYTVYTAIANLIHQAFVPHASNGQRIEGDVQKMAKCMVRVPTFAPKICSRPPRGLTYA
jgi:hypothetical protein